MTFALLISPWLAFNKSHYGTFTTNEQAKQQQMGVVNPKHRTFDLKYIKAEFPAFLSKVWGAEEMNWKAFKNWDPHFMKLTQYLNYTWFAGVILAILLSLYLLVRQKKYKQFFVNFLIIAAIAGATMQQITATIVGNWPVMQGRYLHPVIVPIALMFTYGLYQLRFHFIIRLIAAAIILIPIILNLEYVYMLINS